MPAPRVVPPLAELAKLIKADRENRVQRLAPRFQRIYELGQDLTAAIAAQRPLNVQKPPPLA